MAAIAAVPSRGKGKQWTFLQSFDTGIIFDTGIKKFFFLSCFSMEKYSFHFQARFPGCDHLSIIRYKFLYIVHFLYLCWPITWLKHGVQIKVLELSSSFSRFLIKFPYYSSGFEIKVCHSNWLVHKQGCEPGSRPDALPAGLACFSAEQYPSQDNTRVRTIPESVALYRIICTCTVCTYTYTRYTAYRTLDLVYT